MLGVMLCSGVLDKAINDSTRRVLPTWHTPDHRESQCISFETCKYRRLTISGSSGPRDITIRYPFVPIYSLVFLTAVMANAAF